MTVTVTDSDGAADTDNQVVVVTVANVAPTVTLTGAVSADEGTSKTYSFTTSDPGEDTFTLTATECGTGGSQVGADTFNSTTGAGSFVCSFPDGPASPTVSVTVTDSDGADGSDTVAVTVANVKPSVLLTGAASADEGETKTYSFTVTDPGQDSHTIVTACGAHGAKVAGSDSYNTVTGAGSFKCLFADGPATTNVTVTVTDSDGAADTDNQVVVVTVANVAPTVTLTGAASADEGTSKTYSFTTSDPGEDTFTLTATECGTGGSQVGVDTFNSTTGAGSFVCSFPDGPASPTVTVTVTDSDGADGSDTVDVTVANVKPGAVTVSAVPATVTENNSTTLSGSFTDSGSSDAHTVVINWGDGSANTTVSIPAGTLSFSGQTHQYKDDNPTSTSSDVYTVTVTVTDSDGASGSGNTSVTVNNVAASVTITAPASATIYAVGTPVTFSGTFTDQGTQDTHNMACTSAWACTYWQLDTTKQAATVTESNGSGTASTTYTFTTPGVYNVTLYVRDDDGGVGSASTVNGLNAMVVIYDPSAGFVTGGGYVAHQPSWTTPPISTAGKDNFGFVAKYKKGATSPEGETEFQCKVCNLNFHSTSLDWLIVTSITTGPNAGAQKAWYQGSGTINGGGDYRFQVTFIDKGNTDYFRIKIWHKTTNAVVYDNMPGAADGTDPVTLAQGGNLVIHK